MKTKLITIKGRKVRVRALRVGEIRRSGDVFETGGIGHALAFLFIGEKQQKVDGFISQAYRPKAGKRVSVCYVKSLERIASILGRNLTSDHKVGMIDEILRTAFILPSTISYRKKGK